jgi:nucleoside-diphosphate-sugar epimerase
MKLFVFGMGYSAGFFVREHMHDFASICGTVRAPEKAARIAADSPGLDVLTFDDPRVEPRLAEADILLVSVAPSGVDPVLARFRRNIAASKISRIVYLSTIGVYGGKNGAWVDEATPPDTSAGRADARIAAENEWVALGAETGKKVFVLRLAGIYGPGRNMVENLRAGTARRIVRPGQVFNRIHVADIAQAIAACIATDLDGGVFNVCDDEPGPPQDVITYSANMIGIAPPPEIPFERADLSPMARGFWTNNQRVSNRRLKERLGVRLLYPTYREGLAALAKTD